MIREILLLGDERLYETSAPVVESEMLEAALWTKDLHDTLMAYRAKYGVGRAIAAPQIGVPKRLIYMLTDAPHVFINPVLNFPDDETYTLMDDCMSFPGLMVRVRRFKRADLRYQDAAGDAREIRLEGDLSELLQHEYDHLDGILATMRAMDEKSFSMGFPARAL